MKVLELSSAGERIGQFFDCDAGAVGGPQLLI